MTLGWAEAGVNARRARLVTLITAGWEPHLMGPLVVCRLIGMSYHVTVVTVERVQTGLRIERNTLKVLKGLAEYLDLSLGDLVEGIVLHAFEGKAPFSPPVLGKIEQLKAVYGL